MWVDVVINFMLLQLGFQYIKKKAYGISKCVCMSTGKCRKMLAVWSL